MMHRYGFNGMETDPEVKEGWGQHYTTYFRQYDPRLGRWWSNDPVTHSWESPYAAMFNNPVGFADPFGDCPGCGDPNNFEDGTKRTVDGREYEVEEVGSEGQKVWADVIIVSADSRLVYALSGTVDPNSLEIPWLEQQPFNLDGWANIPIPPLQAGALREYGIDPAAITLKSDTKGGGRRERWHPTGPLYGQTYNVFYNGVSIGDVRFALSLNDWPANELSGPYDPLPLDIDVVVTTDDTRAPEHSKLLEIIAMVGFDRRRGVTMQDVAADEGLGGHGPHPEMGLVPPLLRSPKGLSNASKQLLQEGESGVPSSQLYTHKYKYAPRVRQRGLEDPHSHNFPYSFDDAVLSTTPIVKDNGYRIFQLQGTMNGKKGVFEIGVTNDDIIDHRFFRPTK